MNDARGKLTWQHRFADVQTKTDAFNFYSSTEDVLRIDLGYTGILSGLIGQELHFYAFQLQEIFKGKNDLLANAGGGSDPYNGWAFTKESETHIIDIPVLGWDLKPKNYSHYFTLLGTNAANATIRAAFRETLKTDPLFDPDPKILFGAGAEAFAGAPVGDSSSTFNYNPGNATVDISNLPVRDYLLAKSFPARTGALGSRTISAQVSIEWQKAMLDMFTQYRTDDNAWPSREGVGNNIRVWKHSDFRNVPYVHVYQLYEKLTTKED